MTPLSTKRRQRAYIFLRDGGACVYCAKELTDVPGPSDPERATLDHLVPLCKGGTLHRTNLVLSCGGCNFRRGRRNLLLWLNGLKERKRLRAVAYILQALKSGLRDPNGDALLNDIQQAFPKELLVEDRFIARFVTRASDDPRDGLILGARASGFLKQGHVYELVQVLGELVLRDVGPSCVKKLLNVPGSGPPISWGSSVDTILHLGKPVFMTVDEYTEVCERDNPRECRTCRFSGYDQDGPYCTQPQVTEGHPCGLVLSSRAVAEKCPAPKHPFWKGRE